MLLLATVLLALNPVESDFRREARRCGLVYVDVVPSGDGVLIDPRHRTILLSNSAKRPRKPIVCIGAVGKITWL